MSDASIRDLRNHGGEVVDRVAAGESVVVTRAGRPVAELRPVLRSPLGASALLARWQRLPIVDATEFRRDLDAVMDARL